MNITLKKEKTKFFYLSIIFISFVVFSGCYRDPNKDMAQVMDPLSLDTSLEQAVATHQFQWGGWPDADWWKLFDDPQLASLMEKALGGNPTLKKAHSQVSTAEQNAKKIRSKLFPTLDANYNEDWQYFSKNGFVRSFYPLMGGVQVPATVNQIDLSLNFNYEFDFWGRNRKMFESALGLARAQRAEAAQARLTICVAIAFAYFQMQTHWTELHLYQQMLDLKLEKYDYHVSRRVFGIDTQISPLQAKEEIFSLEQKVSDLHKELLLDQYMLKMLVAEGPDAEIDFSYTPVYFDRSFPLPEHLGADLLARRPDLMAQIWRVEAASYDIGVAKTDFYPNINLSALAGLEALSFNKFLNWDSKTGALQPAIHLPLFTGGRLRANLSQKVAQFNESVHNYNELLLKAANEVVSEITILQSLDDQLQFQTDTLLAQKEVDMLMISRFEKGIDTYLSVITSEEKTLREQITKVDLESFRLLSLVRLIKSLGGGYFSSNPQPYKNKG